MRQNVVGAVNPATGQLVSLIVPRSGTEVFQAFLETMAAEVQDRDGAKVLLDVLTLAFEWLMLIWADGGYAGKLIEYVARIPRHRRVRLEIVKRSDDVKGFKLVPNDGSWSAPSDG